MGELLKQLRKDNMMAMKEHDTVKKGVLGMVISAIALAEKEKGVELSKEDELTYVQRELKQTRDSLQQTPASRTDLIEETKKKIEILESYLPKQLSAEEIKEADVVILAIDIAITGTERFEGKPTIKVPTNVCVKAPKKLIEKIENELGK